MNQIFSEFEIHSNPKKTAHRYFSESLLSFFHHLNSLYVIINKAPRTILGDDLGRPYLVFIKDVGTSSKVSQGTIEKGMVFSQNILGYTVVFFLKK